MSYIIDCGPIAGAGFCTFLRETYTNLAPNLNALTGWSTYQAGVLAALLSPSNATANRVETQGKKRTLSVYATQLYDRGGYTMTNRENPVEACGDGTSIPEIRKDYVFDEYETSEIINITEDEWRGYCTNNAEMLLIRTVRAFQNLVYRLNRQAAARIATKLGPFFDATTSKTIAPFGIFAAGGTIEGLNVKEIGKIAFEYGQLGINQAINVVGYSDMMRAVMPANIASDNMNGQMPAAAFNGIRYFADTQLGVVTGDPKDYFCWPDGAVQLWFNPTYPDQFFEDGDTRKRMTMDMVIPSLVNGIDVTIPVDFAWTRPNNCDDLIQLVLSTKHKLIAPFADACLDDREGVYGLLGRTFVQNFKNV